MNDFSRDLKSPGWWLGVVVVSFLINLAAAYAKPIIDRFFARMSERKLRKLEHAKADLERQTEILAHTPDSIVLLTLDEIKLILGAVLSTSLCITLLVLASIPIPTNPPTKPPVELLFLIPIPLIVTVFLLRESNRKAALLKLLEAKLNPHEA